MKTKSFFLLVLIAFFGIQSINAQVDNHYDTTFYQGWAEGTWGENYWQGRVIPDSIIPHADGIFGVMYVATDDGGDGIYHDLGRNFTWQPDNVNSINEHVMSEFPDEGDIIRYRANYDGYEFLQTNNGAYVRCSSCEYVTIHIAFIFYY